MQLKQFGKITIASVVSSLALGEIVYWALFLVYIGLVLPLESSDTDPMIVFLLLGFYVRPLISVVLAMIVFWLSIVPTKTITSWGDVAAAVMTFVLMSALVSIGSVTIFAAEAKIPVSGIPSIYSLFIR